MTHLFRTGDVCVSLGSVLPKNLFQRLKMQIVYYFIRRYQKRQFPHSRRTDAIHVSWLRPDGLWQEMTTPHCHTIINPCGANEKARFYRWKYFEKLSSEALAEFDRVSNGLVGQEYDIGELVDMELRQEFGWTPDEFRLFDSRKKMVCSTAAMLCFYTAWRALPEGQFHGRSFPKPTTTHDGGYVRLEDVSPATFDGNLPDWSLVAAQNC